MKKTIFFIILIALVCSCNSDPAPNITEKAQGSIEGKTMGTIYRITYLGKSIAALKTEVDSLLVKINEEVSTYEKEAIISLFNQSKDGVELNEKEHAHFLTNYKAAIDIYQSTNGYFDPTVMPLVNYWGFGYTGKEAIRQVDSLKVKDLQKVVGMDRVVDLKETLMLSKIAPDVQLDFSAHAKGYGVDMVCDLLEQKGVTGYFVEIGGEVRTKGKNKRGTFWTIGINTPDEEARLTDFMFLLQVKNEAVATSGNYRNVYEIGGVKYSHTINPFSGFPERNRLLSATVIAADCMTADGFATAFMTMGLDKAFELAVNNPAIEAAFIYSDADGKIEVKYTDGVTMI